MDKHALSLLCDPATHERLELFREPRPHGGEQIFLVNPHSGQRFPIREGIPCFLEPSEVSGPNRKYQKLYDRIAPGYDAAARLYSFFSRQSLEQMRRGYLDEIEMKETGRVLEVSVGTGLNIPFFPRKVEFYGLDISWGMLRKCRRNLTRWRRAAHLFLGAAEALPFQDEVFDAVFHFGGINFFSDRSRAITEMIRVARPGTKIVISDETESHVKRQYERVPFVRRYFRNRKETVSAPIELVPASMLDVRLKEFREGRIYCLTFRKPEARSLPQPGAEERTRTSTP
jgi:ubiquinone/menaquinone biosynthesis C-methylase UbiE